MAAKTDTVPDIGDEEIIELTDIIALGTPVASKDSTLPADDHLKDLQSGNAVNSAVEEGEDELDALLAEIGAAPPHSANDTDERTRPSAVNPDETLNMPDMQEVENLLDGLKLPAQPAPAAAEPEPADELDALLDSVPPATPAATPKAEPEPAATPKTEPEPADELDALLDSITTPPAPATAPAAPAAGDLDALLDSVATPSDSEAAPAAVDLDALLDSVPPATPVVTPKAEPEPVEYLGALLDSATATSPAPAPPSAAMDLDALLGSVAPSPAASDTPLSAALPPAFLERTERLEQQMQELHTLLQSTEQRLEQFEARLNDMERKEQEARESDTLLRSMEQRLEQLEIQLSKMESGTKDDLDRAAAAAAARILREELASIFAEGAA